MQSNGVRVLAMVGGDKTRVKDFRNLDADFDLHYPALRNALEEYAVDGIDLNIEETGLSEEFVGKLVTRLR